MLTGLHFSSNDEERGPRGPPNNAVNVAAAATGAVIGEQFTATFDDLSQEEKNEVVKIFMNAAHIQNLHATDEDEDEDEDEEAPMTLSLCYLELYVYEENYNSLFQNY